MQIMGCPDDLILPRVMAGYLECDISEHFVGVHVGGCARPALVPINQKLIVVFPGKNGLASLLDGCKPFPLHRTYIRIGPSRIPLYQPPAPFNPRDRFIFTPGSSECFTGRPFCA